MVIGNLRRKRALQGIAGISRGIDQWHVNAFFTQSTGAFKIRQHALRRDIETQLHGYRLIVAVNRKLVVKGSARQVLETFQRGLQTVFKNKVTQFMQIIQFEFIHHVHQSPMSDLITRG